MAINFPDSPEVGDVYLYNDRGWTWGGEAWTPNRPVYTANRDIVSDSEGYLVASVVTSTELARLSGVTDVVQTQIDGKADLTSPTFLGVPLAPTASVGVSTDQIATTAFVIGQASVSDPLAPGVADSGTLATYSRGDHVHPIDITLAPKSSPTFTGAVTVSSSGLVFPDGTQTKAGVPSLTVIKPNISANATTSTLTAALTYRDTITAISGAYTVTIDADTTNSITFPIGSSMNFYQSSGNGGASIVAGATVTLLVTPGLIFRALNSSVTVTKVAANTWLVYGDLKS